MDLGPEAQENNCTRYNMDLQNYYLRRREERKHPSIQHQFTSFRLLNAGKNLNVTGVLKRRNDKYFYTILHETKNEDHYPRDVIKKESQSWKWQEVLGEEHTESAAACNVTWSPHSPFLTAIYISSEASRRGTKTSHQ